MGGPHRCNTDWNTGASWSGGVAPANSTSTDSAIFTSVSNAQPNVAISSRISGIDFQMAAGGLNMTGNQLFQLGSGGINATGQTSGTNTISVARFALAADSNWTLFSSVDTNSTSIFTFNAAVFLQGRTLTIAGQRNSAAGNVGIINFTRAIGGTSTVPTGAGNVIINSASANNTVTFSGANTYTGTTTVSGGKLLINGNQSVATGAVSVASGATLGGSGTIGGATTIASGATLAAGNSPGVLTFSSSLTLNSGSFTTMELAGNGGAAGTDFDRIVVGTALTFGGSLNIVSFGGYDLNQVGTYDLFDFVSSSGGFGSVSVASTALTNSGGIWSGVSGTGLNYTFSQADGVFAVSAIPEPSTFAALAGLGVLFLAAYRRRQSV